MASVTAAEWREEAERLFGPDPLKWRFRCPACGHVATVQDWKDAGAPEGAVAFSCVGRWAGAKREAFAKGEGPCNYAGGGLFAINPIRVVDGDNEHCVFEFAPLTKVDRVAADDSAKCRVCGCTDDDCRQCIEKSGEPCYWVEPDLCSACVASAPSAVQSSAKEVRRG